MAPPSVLCHRCSPGDRLARAMHGEWPQGPKGGPRGGAMEDTIIPAEPSAFLVLNGKVAMRDDVRAAVRAVREEGCRVEVRVTWEGGDATRFARQAAEAGFRLVVAGGGDGTVNEVVEGLVDGQAAATATPSLGIV